MSAIPVLFLIMDSIPKILVLEPVVEATTQLGYPESVIPGIGILLLICTILYTVPHTAFLGAILLTGYLGGAVATHVRIGNPLFSHVLFPVYLGILLWGGLYLRDMHLRAFIPLRKKD
ncbi:MAG: DoxX family protein [Calditrichia bacterium]